jgi:hypothetical protein
VRARPQGAPAGLRQPHRLSSRTHAAARRVCAPYQAQKVEKKVEARFREAIQEARRGQPSTQTLNSSSPAAASPQAEAAMLAPPPAVDATASDDDEPVRLLGGRPHSPRAVH